MLVLGLDHEAEVLGRGLGLVLGRLALKFQGQGRGQELVKT